MATKTSVTAIVLLLSLCALSITHGQTSHELQELQTKGRMSPSLEALVIKKKERVQLELDRTTNLEAKEWAGSYYAVDGHTAGTQLHWAPAAGFVVHWSTCSHGWRDMINYGGAVFENRVLKLQPQLVGSGGKIYPAPNNLVPVKWDQQHFLVPSDRLANFAYAALNAKSSLEIGEFFLKEGDGERSRSGLPNLPPEYKKFLIGKPVVAVITEVKPNSERWIGNITLNAGRAGGVVPGMKFYLIKPGNIQMLVEIVEAHDHVSEAFIVTYGYRDNPNRKFKPHVGWKLTSRAPEDASMYYPG